MGLHNVIWKFINQLNRYIFKGKQKEVPEIPILHQISPTLASGRFCSLIEKDFKAISFINTVNAVRKMQGLKPIRPDNTLCNVALLHGYDQFVSNALAIWNIMISVFKMTKPFLNFS